MSEVKRKQTVMKALSAHFNNELDRRELAGDETVRIHRLYQSLPWSLDALGPAIVDPGQLSDIEQGLVKAGSLQNYFDGRAALTWTRSRSELISLFLASIATSDSELWDEFAEAHRPVFAEVERVKSIPPEELPESPMTAVHDALQPLPLPKSFGQAPAPNRPKHWTDSFPEIAQSHSVARKVHAAACSEAWSNAFLSGRILVCERVDRDWEFRPPHLFESQPPFPCTTLEEIEDGFREEERVAREAEKKARAARKAEGRETLRDVFLSNKFDFGDGYSAFTIGGGTRSIAKPRDPANFAFLFSAQLPIEEPEQLSKVSTKSRGGAPENLLDAPIVEDLASRVESGEFPNANQAVSHLLRNEYERLEGHLKASDDAHKRRLRDKIKKRLERGKTQD